MASLESYERCHQGVARGKFKRRLSEVNARAMSKGQNELVCKFKMAAGDMVSIRGTGYGVHVHFNRNQKGDDEIWCGLRLEGTVGR